MAKRKRLSPAQSDYLEAQGPAPETKSMPLGKPPIAQVAGDVSLGAALEEMSGAWASARDEGRLVQVLPLDAVEVGYLVRDRLMADDEELQALMESLRARGQQTPIEVVALPEGRFGLISGWRRLTALRRLRDETGDDRFGEVLALLRRPETAADAYVAMVEENEIRVGLSYYERARVAAMAVEQGVYDDEKRALLSLYASASRAKRSKIRSFLTVYHAADDLLRFPSSIGERTGLALAKALDGDDTLREALRGALERAAAESPEEEMAVLQSVLETDDGTGATDDRFRSETVAPETPAETVSPVSGTKPEPAPKPEKPARSLPVEVERITPYVTAEWDGYKLSLSGVGMTENFRRKLLEWVRERRSNP